MTQAGPSPLGAWLCEQARALGFDDVALVRADRGTPGAEALRRATGAGHFGPLDYLRASVEERADVLARYPGARTVAVVVQNYFTGHHEEHASADELARGARVSRYAWGRDYHKSMRRRLRKLRTGLLERAGPGASVWIFNDVDPVLERAWAEAAGLGFVGKSAVFIHRQLGTWTFLGGLITTLDLGAPDPAPPARFCGTCTACLDACPTGALLEPGVLDARRCLTTWNIERPAASEGDAPELVGHGWAAGCDVCQEVCPWNRFEKRTDEARFQPLPGHVVLEPGRIPEDLPGTPLARPKREGLEQSCERSLRRAR